MYLVDHLSAQSIEALPARSCRSNDNPIAYFGDLSEIHDGKRLDKALLDVESLDQRNVPIPNDVIYCILLGCTKRKDLGLARRLHMHMSKKGLTRISIFGDYLIRLFASCGSLVEAHSIFRMVTKPTAYTWNAILSAYVNVDEVKKALDLYREMQRNNAKPSRATFILLLKACSFREGLEQGKQLHNQIIRSGVELRMDLGNTLVDMYGKGGDLEESLRVFNDLPSRDAISYGALISGYTQHDQAHLAIKLYQRMQKEGIQPNRSIFLCMMKACGKTGALELGRLLHRHILRSGLLLDIIIASTLIDMYVKCFSLEEAHKVFEKLPNRSILAWGILITGYAQRGHYNAALRLYGEMQVEGIKPDRAILLGAMKACSNLGTIGQGRLIHDQVIRGQFDADVSAGNALVDMYAKCGSLGESFDMLKKLPNRDVVSWGGIVAGCMSSADFKLAWQCLKSMQEEGLKPSVVVATSVLAGCSHAGRIEEGYKFFNSMTKEFGIVPSVDHCNCIVDLLGRAGYLNEAEKLVRSMPLQSCKVMWRSLLASCLTYGNKDLGKKCLDELVRLEPSNASGCVLMSDIREWLSDCKPN